LDLRVIDVGDLVLGWILVDVYTDPRVAVTFALGFYCVVFRCLLKTVDSTVAVEVDMLFEEGRDNAMVVDVVLSSGSGSGGA
jgi:hypothetical protein